MIPKFRAWDKVAKKMSQVTAIDFSTKPFRVFYKAYGNENYFNQDAILMQSTGLKDKNGVEIFEGDILENTTQISYLGEKYKVVKNEKYASFILLDDKGLASNIPISESETGYEVIGNIYENSEFLYEKEMKKYYLRHKYLSDFGIPEWNYLNLDRGFGFDTLHINSGESDDNFQTQFTDDDIENLVQNHGLNLIDWIKEEVV